MAYDNTIKNINHKALQRIDQTIHEYEERRYSNDVTVKRVKEIVQQAKDERRLLIQRNRTNLLEINAFNQEVEE